MSDRSVGFATRMLGWAEERLDRGAALRTRSPLGAARYGKKWSTAKDLEWESNFNYFCESPAETAFLKTMIEHFCLKPEKGKLIASGVSLDLQVEIIRYRADFVVNDWLVVEIDGAAYHSSLHAIERDGRRDKDLRELGYEVLRIPASIVFEMPSEAVRRLRQALAEPNVQRASQSCEKSTKQITALSLLRSFGSAIEKVNKSLDLRLSCIAALQPANHTFQAERFLFTTALKHAEAEIQVADFCSHSEENAELYDRHLAEYTAIFEEELRDTKDQDDNPFLAALSPFHQPCSMGSTEIDEAVERRYRDLLQERTTFFRDLRARLDRDPRLAEPFRSFVVEQGCLACLISLDRA